MIYAINLLIGIGWGGFALAMLWGWFIAPLGVLPIAWWHAAGLMTAYFALTGGQPAFAFQTYLKVTHKAPFDAEGPNALFVSIAVPAICLAAGFTLRTLGPIVERAL